MADRRIYLRFAAVAASAIAYAACNMIGKHFVLADGVSLIFPASAAAVVFSLWFGYAGAAGVFIGTLLTPWGGETPLQLTAAGFVNSLEGLIPYWLFRGRPRLDCTLKELRSFLHFAAAGILANTFVAAALGALVSDLLRYLDAEYLTKPVEWWMADAVACLILATPLLMVYTALLSRTRLQTIMPAHARRPSRLLISYLWQGHWRTEFLAMVASFLAINLLLGYTERHGVGTFHWFAVLYTIPIIWGALRFGVRGGVVAGAIGAVSYLATVVSGLDAGRVPLGESESVQKVVTVYANIVVFALTGIVVGFLADAERVLRRRLQEKNRLLSANTLWVIQALSAAVEAKDPHAPPDMARLESFALELGERFGMNEGEIRTLRLGALLHDVGKIAVRDEVLLKPGTLTREERSHVEGHIEAGVRILEAVDSLRPAIPLVRSHHERWDGEATGPYRGYPQGLKHEAIPLGARILAIVDAYDALRQQRPYRGARSHEEALRVLRDEAGAQFDPRIVAAFIEIAEAREVAGARE